MKVFKAFGTQYELENNTLLVTREVYFKFAKLVVIENENKFGIKLNNSNVITFYNKVDLKDNFYILILKEETEEDNEINIRLVGNETYECYSKSFEIKKPEPELPEYQLIAIGKDDLKNKIINFDDGIKMIKEDTKSSSTQIRKKKIDTNVKEIYGVPVKTINQTTIWKILKAVCEKQDEKGIEIANQLFIQYPEIFNNSKRCLASKKKIAYIDSILEEA